MPGWSRHFFSKKSAFVFLLVSTFAFPVNPSLGAVPLEENAQGPQVLVIENGADPLAEDSREIQGDEPETGGAPSPDSEPEQTEPVPVVDPVGDDFPLVVPEMIANTGAMAYRVPIALPPGRNGIEPSLSLSYNSRSGNGWVGVGWHFDAGVIRRSVRNKRTEYDKRDFLHVHSGHYEELVPREGDWGAGFYGAKIEGAFSKYYLDPVTGGWVIFARDGRKYFFGSSKSSRLDVVQTWDGKTGGTFEWYLDAIEDPNGNRVTFHHALVHDHVWDTFYLDKIVYPGGKGTVEVRCVLEAREDTIQSLECGCWVLTTKRLKQIEVWTGGDLCRKYVLAYDKNPDGKSRVSSVKEVGADGKTALTTLKFSYGLWAGNGGSLPEYLSCITEEGQSVSIIVTYDPSSKYYSSSHPFICEVVSSISVYDGLGGVSTTRYGYAEEDLEITDVVNFRGFRKDISS